MPSRLTLRSTLLATVTPWKYVGVEFPAASITMPPDAPAYLPTEMSWPPVVDGMRPVTSWMYSRWTVTPTMGPASCA